MSSVPLQSKSGSGLTTQKLDSRALHEAAALCGWNAAEKGDTDVLPRSTEFRLLRGYTGQLAEAVLGGDDPPAVATVTVPLSRTTHRRVHLLDPPTYLRLFAPVFMLADRLETARVSHSIATSARWAPNRSRGRIVLPGSYQRRDDGVARLRRLHPFLLHLDLCTFFPALTHNMIHESLARFGKGEADLFAQELARLDIRGLPVGGWPARLVGEAVLDRVDHALLELGREHVRAIDDITIGVDSNDDAEEVIRRVSEIVAPLELNKAKTRICKVEPVADADEPVEVARRLLCQDGPDRVVLQGALGQMSKLVPGWDRRKRERWLHLLVDASVRVRVCVPQILRMIDKLTHGTEGPNWGTLVQLLASPEPLIRAEAARFLSRHRQDVQSSLVMLTLADECALVRREALFGLVRLNATKAVNALLRSSPTTALDQGAWIVAAGVLGQALPVLLASPYQRLLHQAASEHRPSEVW